MAEVARVLRPDGLCVVSFSNRWFPEKVTRIWQQLHEFERLGYVLEIMQTCFHELTSTTFRNWPRASDDPHYFEKKVSDPLYLVTGRKK
jgi:SAM-dependent methyltransferase